MRSARRDRHHARGLIAALGSKAFLRAAVAIACACSFFVTCFLVDGDAGGDAAVARAHIEPANAAAAFAPREVGALVVPSVSLDDADAGADPDADDEEEDAEDEADDGGGGDDADDDGALQLEAPPIVLTVEPFHGAAIGGATVTVHGHNMRGPDGDGSSVRCFIGGAACASTRVLDAETLTCVVPPSAGLHLSVSVRKVWPGHAEVSSAPNTLFSYHAPSISRVTPTKGQTGGGTPLTIFGSDFGPKDVPIAVTVGAQPAQRITKISDKEIRCATPAGEVGAATIAVAVLPDDPAHAGVSPNATTTPAAASDAANADGDGAIVPAPAKAKASALAAATATFAYVLTPMERLRRESGDLLEGLRIDLAGAGVPLVFHTTFTLGVGRGGGAGTPALPEFVSADLLTGKPITFVATPELASVLPDADLKPKAYATCALVFNSKQRLMAGKAKGRAIDRHDAVFRFNDAPAGSAFAARVGSKTTHRFAQTPLLRAMLARDPELRKRANKPQRGEALIVPSQHALDFYVRVCKAFPYASAYLISNAFVENLRTTYVELKKRFLAMDGRVSMEQQLQALGSSAGNAGRRKLLRGDPTKSYRDTVLHAPSSTSGANDVEPARDATDPPIELLSVLFCVQMCRTLDVYGYEGNNATASSSSEDDGKEGVGEALLPYWDGKAGTWFGIADDSDAGDGRTRRRRGGGVGGGKSSWANDDATVDASILELLSMREQITLVN